MKRKFLICCLLLVAWGSFAEHEIPVTVDPFYQVEVTTNQIEYVRSLAKKMVSSEEFHNVRISFSNNRHPGTDYYATIHLPRMTTSTHAVYRNIKVDCSDWPNRHFGTQYHRSRAKSEYEIKNDALKLPDIDLPPSKPQESDPVQSGQWHNERYINLVPLFRMGGGEYELYFDPSLSRKTVSKILQQILSGEVIYFSKGMKLDELPMVVNPTDIEPIDIDKEIAAGRLPINVDEISDISFHGSLLEINASKRTDSYHPQGLVYWGYVKDEKLVIILVSEWIS